MDSKQVAAIASAFALIFILIYPALSTGTISILVGSEDVAEAEHVYVTINDVWAHRRGHAGSEGWELVSNKSQRIDMVALENETISLGEGQVPVASYDVVRMSVSNVTWVYNATTTNLQLESNELPANVEFTVRSGKESVITLLLSGHQEERVGGQFFKWQLNATVS